LRTKGRFAAGGEGRAWRDIIPLHYEYTAGVAGERFLRGLIEGKIVGARCDKCKITYLPPKVYCTNCFNEIRAYVDLGVEGEVSALSEVHIDFRGRRIKRPYLMGFIVFKGAKGGIIQRVTGRAPRIGSKVVARFEPKEKRKGAMTDIASFAVVP